MAMRTRALLALAIVAALLSFTKFSHCEGINWATPGQYIHACYSDLPSLFGERGKIAITSVNVLTWRCPVDAFTV